MISRQSPDAKSAARYAYDALFASREAVVSSYRVPIKYDARQVDVGLQRRLARLTEGEMYLAAPLPGLSDEETRTSILRNVRRNGRWISNEDSSDVYLMVAGKPALDAGGRPIQVRFQDALTEAVSEGERYREQARLDSLARGLK